MKSLSRLLLFCLLAASLPLCHAQSDSTSGDWLARVSATQARQPHWITPVLTVTPLLEQEVRFDVMDQQMASGHDLLNIGGGKGVELIPASHIEVIFNAPPYLMHNAPSTQDGFGDTSFLVKYRLFSRDHTHGDAVVTAFLGSSFDTGSPGNGAGATVWTPTLAAGKGWGNFDVQTTLGVGLPASHADRLGDPVQWNAAFQDHVLPRFWPEVEVNTTWFHGGLHRGEAQTFLTPGLVLGKIPIHNRVGLTVGAGMQIATTRFHTDNHNLVISLRLPF